MYLLCLENITVYNVFFKDENIIMLKNFIIGEYFGRTQSLN